MDFIRIYARCPATLHRCWVQGSFLRASLGSFQSGIVRAAVVNHAPVMRVAIDQSPCGAFPWFLLVFRVFRGDGNPHAFTFQVFAVELIELAQASSPWSLRCVMVVCCLCSGIATTRSLSLSLSELSEPIKRSVSRLRGFYRVAAPRNRAVRCSLASLESRRNALWPERFIRHDLSKRGQAVLERWRDSIFCESRAILSRNDSAQNRSRGPLDDSVPPSPTPPFSQASFLHPRRFNAAMQRVTSPEPSESRINEGPRYALRARASRPCLPLAVEERYDALMEIDNH